MRYPDLNLSDMEVLMCINKQSVSNGVCPCSSAGRPSREPLRSGRCQRPAVQTHLQWHHQTVTARRRAVHQHGSVGRPRLSFESALISLMKHHQV